MPCWTGEECQAVSVQKFCLLDACLLCSVLVQHNRLVLALHQVTLIPGDRGA
jgi:hypothetical protein